MNILAVDDEPIMLWSLKSSLEKVFSGSDDTVNNFDEIDDAMDYIDSLGDERLDYAFLDTKLRGIDGINFAALIKEKKPMVRIVFCTAYSDKALDAFNVNAIGYLLKPITEEKIRNLLKQIDYMFKDSEKRAHIEVKTFGNFEVFVDGKTVIWHRQKAKELFAFLIDKQGASVTNSEIALALWETDANVKSVATIISSLRSTLKEYGIEEVLVRARNSTAVNTTKLKCDVYDLYNGSKEAKNLYNGEYMANYSWAEFTNAQLITYTGYDF